MNKGLNPGAKEWVPRPAAPDQPQMSAEMMMYMMSIINAVAIDCEMVGVKPSNKSALAHVAIIDFFGNQIYNKYVLPPGGINSISDYRTRYSGISRETLTNPDNIVEDFETVKAEVHLILNGKTIVGHGLVNDFNVLDYDPSGNTVWDTTLINLYMQNGQHHILPNGSSKITRVPRKLKVLAKEIANNNIQKNERNASGKPKGHSPLEDARASMNLYRIAYGFPKTTYADMAIA